MRRPDNYSTFFLVFLTFAGPMTLGGLSPKFQSLLFFSFFWQTRACAMASLPPPTAGRRQFRGNALVAHIMGDSSPAQFDQIHRWGGDLHNNSPGRFEGVVAATTWGNRHCLYRRPRPEDARSGATRLLPDLNLLFQS
jgi:hypothetical protein